MTEGRRMPVRTAEIQFDGIYAGFTATVRTNPRYRTKVDLSSGDQERFLAALKAIVVKWDFTDEDGAPIPAGAPEDVPDDLLAELVHRWGEAVGEAAQLPKS